MGNSSRGHGVLSFHVERTWFKPAVTSSNWFLSVLHMTSEQYSLACHITSSLDFNKGGCVIQIEWTKSSL